MCNRLTITKMSFNTVDQGLLRTRNDEIDLLWKGIDAGVGEMK